MPKKIINKKIINKEIQATECEKFKKICNSNSYELSGEDWCEVPYYFHIGKNKIYPDQSQCHDLNFLIKTWEGQLGFEEDGWPSPQWPRDPFNRHIISIDKFLELVNYYESFGYELPKKLQILLNYLQGSELWKPFMDGTLNIEDEEILKKTLFNSFYPDQRDADFNDKKLVGAIGKAIYNRVLLPGVNLDLFHYSDFANHVLRNNDLADKLQEGLNATQNYLFGEIMNYFDRTQTVTLTNYQLRKFIKDFGELTEKFYKALKDKVDWVTWTTILEFIDADPDTYMPIFPLFKESYDILHRNKIWDEFYRNTFDLLMPGTLIDQTSVENFIDELVDSFSISPSDPEKLKQGMTSRLNHIISSYPPIPGYPQTFT